jgi:hypothetical protein
MVAMTMPKQSSTEAAMPPLIGRHPGEPEERESVKGAPVSANETSTGTLLDP